MLDIGFLPDLQRILSYLPQQRTTLLFSATFSPEIKRLAGSYLQDPVTIEVARPNETASTVEQRFYSAGDDDKRRAIHQVLKTRGIKQAFIFVNSKLGCGRLARSLEREGLRTAALHGEDMKRLYLSALEHIDAARGQAFNIGGGVDNSLSLLELLRMLEEITGTLLAYDRLPVRESDQRVFIADISKARRLLGWEPRMLARDGVTDMVRWTSETFAYSKLD